ncbi:MAG: cell division protein FtsA [Alphaproteobacteria bacterium]|nr:cell division protein FtsA [Alphaproteobacteria bacterium]
MSKKPRNGKIIACLDMGSSKLVCVIASIDGEEIKILGHGHKESRGIMASAISDMRLAQKSITNTVAEAERMAGFNVNQLLIGISGSQVTSTHQDVECKVGSDVVKNSDIINLTNKVRAEFKKKNREIIHLVPLQYRLDDSEPISNPRYMSGKKLYAKFHVVSTSQTTIKNIENCLKRCQLSVNSYIVEPYASALSCLSENEMNIGTLLLDIGGSSTSFCLISEGKLVYTGNSRIGGSHITKDISTILGVSFSTAEKIKNLNSSLLISPIEEREVIRFRTEDVEDGEVISITRLELCEIISSRLEELFESVKSVLEKSGVPFHMLGNIVITGGVSLVVGIDKLATEIFGKNVRIGYPNRLSQLQSGIINPANSCPIGMLAFLRNLHLREKIKSGFETKTSLFRRLIDKLVM